MAIALTDSIKWVGVNDRLTHLFESLWPLPRGVAYNSYVINDDKTVVVDALKPLSPTAYLEDIREVLGSGRDLDYLVVNHMEPDHSGGVQLLKEAFPEMQILANKRTTKFLREFYGLEDCVKEMADGETLSLGNHELKFVLTPMVHWPETMMTFETTTGTLFAGDAFGAFGALDGGIFDDEIDIDSLEDEIRRYFANIVGKYSKNVLRALDKLADAQVQTIASTHGPVWRSNPKRIIEMYESMSRHEGENGVLLVFGSMYGNTQRMAEAVAEGVREGGIIDICVRDVSRTNVSYLLRDAWKYKGIALGAPTHDQKLFPLMADFVKFLENKGLGNRVAGVFGSYGWSGGAVDRLVEVAYGNNWNLVKPVVEACCTPSKDDLQNCHLLGRTIAQELTA